MRRRRQAEISVPFSKGCQLLPARMDESDTECRISVPFSKGCQLLPRMNRNLVISQPDFSPLLKGVPITSGEFHVSTTDGRQFQSPSQRGANYFNTLREVV